MPGRLEACEAGRGGDALIMLKYGHFEEADTVYEAFLPESDRESGGWLIRASRRGHVVAERNVQIEWRPLFGPDVGDVAALEAGLDRLIRDIKDTPFPEGRGDYVPGDVQIEPPEPALHVSLHAILQDFQDAAAKLGLTAEAIGTFLGLPENTSIEDLYPIAVTKARYGRMQRIVALCALSERHASIGARRAALIEAVLKGDDMQLNQELAATGFEPGSSS